MRNFVQALLIGLTAATSQGGCRDNSPEVARVPPPAIGRETYARDYEPRKPLPPQEEGPGGPGPFVDEPLVVDIPPEAKAYIEVYRQVGKPRIVVFVNRGFDGQILPVTDPGPDRVTERVKKATTGVTVETRDYEHSANHRGEKSRDTTDRFESKGPGEYRETTEVYLKHGQYDEVTARAIDYEMMELLLSDWMSADNQVTIISPRTARRKLTEQQAKDLEEGKPAAMTELAKALDVDILIQVQAKPTKQSFEGLQVRVIAEAINIKGGESLARATVDVMPPLDKVQTNKYTRFLARKLMDGMTGSWAPAPAEKKPAPAK